ncbi:MAG: hydrolase 1, exosortase A system-associated [Methylococcales bacterium]
MMQETPIVFKCHEDNLIGIIHRSSDSARLGVLLVVGGPQYRVGSHRQFVLLARMLAANGVPVMRFDYRGMGDSEGEVQSFTTVDDDIAAAIAAYYQACPELTGIVIWALCDAASAAAFYAYQDERVQGLVLLNPWVFTEQGAATTYLKHYYLQRLLNPDFWRKVYTLKFNYLESLFSLLTIFAKLLNKPAAASNKTTGKVNEQIQKIPTNLSLPVRMKECLRRFKYPILLILSGKDLTADEFKDVVAADTEWQALVNDSQATRYDFAEADHTFSSALWRNQVADRTLDWLNELNAKLKN